MTLPLPFLDRPLAHRGLHDAQAGVIENGAGAFRAAIAASYGIELDVQPSADGVPVVFHDARLDRLTRETGPVVERRARDLARIRLGEGSDTILPLSQILDLVAGRVPVLIEIKAQPSRTTALAQATGRCAAAALQRHGGPIAIMSFDPEAIAALSGLDPAIPRGITSMAEDGYSDDIPPARRRALGRIADFDRVGASFVSHDRRDLDTPRLAELGRRGVPILCWTIRSPAEAAAARRIASNITFEGFRPG